MHSAKASDCSNSEEEIPDEKADYDLDKDLDLLDALQETVQNPPPGLIRYSDLQWIPHITTGHGSTFNSEIATIPWNRLDDFVQGQEQDEDYPATFNKHVRRKNPPGSLAFPRAASAAQVIRYHCCFGPQDHSNVPPEDVQALLDSTVKTRKETPELPSRRRKKKKAVPEYNVYATTSQSKGKRKRVGKKQAGMSRKRGCQCFFFVKQPYKNPSICQIVYRQSKHTDQSGNVVHGYTVAGFKDALGAGLSDGMKQHLSNLLWLGLSPSQVMAQHRTLVMDLANQNGVVNRDTFVRPQDIRNIAKLQNEALWQKHRSDPKSVKMWVDENPDLVFCYRQHGQLDLNKKKQDDTPFTLGIQTPWQLQMLLKHGKNSAISFDATFGTSEYRYPLYSAMVFDEWQNGIPVAFFVISQCREKDLEYVLNELQKRASEQDMSWAPSSLIVDNAQAEINVLRRVWPEAQIFLCLWHVQKSWKENAVKKIPTIGERAFILKALGNIMYAKGLDLGTNPVTWAQQQLDTLTAERPIAIKFMKYMSEHWRSKAGMWCMGNRRIPHACQNTNAAIESYHGNLKIMLRSSRERLGGRRLDWLIYHLIHVVITHYWYAVQCKLFGFVRNKSQERIVASAVLQAKEIPDSAVRIFPNNEDVALVASINHSPMVWTIHCPDSEWARCDCPIGDEGLLCKHVMKVFRILHPEVSDGLIIREAGTNHGVDKTTPLSQCFISGGLPSETLQDLGGSVEDNGFPGLEENEVNPEVEDNDVNPAVENDENSTPQNSCKTGRHEDLKVTAELLFGQLLEAAQSNPYLFDSLIADLKSARGKQCILVARQEAGVQHPDVQREFGEVGGDRSLKRYRSFLEPKSRKVLRTRNR